MTCKQQVRHHLMTMHAAHDSRVEADQLKVVHGLVFVLSAGEQELSAACECGLQLGLPLVQQAAVISKQCTASAL